MRYNGCARLAQAHNVGRAGNWSETYSETTRDNARQAGRRARGEVLLWRAGRHRGRDDARAAFGGGGRAPANRRYSAARGAASEARLRGEGGDMAIRARRATALGY